MEPVRFEKGCYVGTKIKEQAFGCILTSETVFPNGSVSEWHYHQNPHYSHILSGGSKEIRKTGAQWQQAGEVLYYHPGICHQNLQYHPGTRIFNIELEPNFFTGSDLGIPSEELMFSDSLKINCAGMLRILKECYCRDQDSRITVEQLCIELVTGNTVTERHYPEWSRRILEILNDQWNCTWSLAGLSELLDVHPVTLSKYFSKYFKCTLGEYIRRIRVEKALRLIRQKQHSLTEIAYLCGFSDQAHFTRTFVLVSGMRPKQYRNI
ncbi:MULTISPECIES: helix-turn-helix domain-containing protein [Niastella]|uniref:Helix-turn-helix transcriptional regulator n=1 Tax=Niastella soli TaxID=2821487 RepID=A0ABS3Z5F6_9BACT|nr:helix-turn-helix domain-containing protein [Niastella soli]MBO9205273.1 helix-turn-helix transcriptional regulator [Niastella soli]